MEHDKIEIKSNSIVNSISDTWKHHRNPATSLSRNVHGQTLVVKSSDVNGIITGCMSTELRFSKCFTSFSVTWSCWKLVLRKEEEAKREYRNKRTEIPIKMFYFALRVHCTQCTRFMKQQECKTFLINTYESTSTLWSCVQINNTWKLVWQFIKFYSIPIAGEWVNWCEIFDEIIWKCFDYR